MSRSLRLFAFLVSRTVVNALVKRVRRLKEPRYLVGLGFGILYFVTVFSRSGRRGGASAPAPPASMRDVMALISPALAAGILVLALLSWMFRKGSSSLGLSEAEVQFLFPAPLSRNAVIHFALLRPQLGLLFSAVLTTVLLRRNLGLGALRGSIGMWLLLATLHLHFLGMGFTKASWEALADVRRRVRVLATLAISLGALVALGVLLARVARDIQSSLDHGDIRSLSEVALSIGTSRAGRVLFTAVWPIRAVLAPLFAFDGASFLRSLPAALFVLLVHYVWVARTSVAFEESTVAHATRRARDRARRLEGRRAAAVPEGRRDIVPFALAPTGRPEIAIFWKNLLATARVRVRSLVLAALAGALILAAAAAWAARKPDLAAVPAASAPFIALTAFLVSSMLITTLRSDLRGDLEHAAEMKTWPVAPGWLAAGEIATPWLVSTLVLWAGILLGLATLAGAAVGSGLSRTGAGDGGTSFRVVLPIALGAALFLPALNGILLVLQNALVLAFPAWFPPGRKRAQGLEAMGTRLFTMLVLVLALVLALVPAAILVVPLALFGAKLLGPWLFAIGGFLGALPLLAEIAAGLSLLGQLFQKFDPAAEGG